MLEEEFDEVGWTPCTHIQGANRGKSGLVCYNFIAFLEDLVVERLGTYVSFGIGFGTFAVQNYNLIVGLENAMKKQV